MRLVTYRHDKSISCGIATDKGIVDIPSAWQGDDAPTSIQDVLERGPDCLDRLQKAVEASAKALPVETVELLADRKSVV